VDYVRKLIRKRKLLPDDFTIEHWPWPVRVFTLGQFKVLIDGEDIPETKAQLKPFALLQVLIALGGAEVKIDRITEIIWPDAEGDAAVSAFTTTVSRLRKLIGEQTIIVKGGRMTLNERHCWADVRALERLLDRTDNPESNDALEFAEKLLALYRGSFLSDEEGEWVHRRRTRLREKFSRRFAQCINALRTSEMNETAARLLEKAMDVDADIGHLYIKPFPILAPSP
jgi:DNA-binding SARP family transcriptional activator